jgi:RNA polymerase sigma-70 factor, ECF subfamily
MASSEWIHGEPFGHRPALHRASTAAAPSRPAQDVCLVIAPADEERLIRRVQQGDSTAFDTLVRQYLGRAYTVAFRVVRHREDAEDVVQEGFLSALDHIDSFEVGRPFGPWLYRILVNRGLSLVASRTRRATQEIPDSVAGSGQSPLRQTLGREVREHFDATVAKLPERQRVAVQLHDVDGFSAEEIGEALGIASGTVRWYVHQARRTLRGALGPLHDGTEDSDETG